MEKFRKTGPMIILRDKGRCTLSMNLLIRTAAYKTMRDRNDPSLHQIKTVKREMKIRKMVRLTNTPGEYDGCKMNPDSSSGIYMTTAKESQCRIVDKNRTKQDEVKENPKK